MVKKTLAAILAGVYLTLPNEATAPDFLHMTQAEAKQVELKQKIYRKEKYEQTISDIQYAFGLERITRDEAELIYKHKEPLIIDHYELKKNPMYLASTVATVSEFLFDKSLWMRLPWKAYDKLPADVRDATLKRIFKDYGYAANQNFQVTNQQLDNVPPPVLVANYISKIRKWVNHWNQDKTKYERNEMERTLTAIMLQESFATAPRNMNLKKNSDYGLFQISPDTRRVLRNKTEFKEYSDEDFHNPDVSIKAGVYWFTLCMRDAEYNTSIAIRSYNAGFFQAVQGTKRAKDYEASVAARYKDYLNEQVSPTMTDILKQSEIADLENF